MAELLASEDFLKIQKSQKLAEVATSDLNNSLRPKDHMDNFSYVETRPKILPKSEKKICDH